MNDDLFDNQLDAGPAGPAVPFTWDEAATIEVHRRRERYRQVNAYEIFIDDRAVESLLATPCAVYPVRAGWHTISAKMDRARTETVVLHLAIGEQAVFRVGTSDGFRRAGHRCWLLSGLMVAIGFLASIVDQLWHSVHGSVAEVVIVRVFWVLIATVGLCGLLFLRRLMPWRPPGDVIALERMEEIDDSRPVPLE